MLKQLTRKQFILPAILMAGFAANLAMAQGMAKSQVGNLIKQVEDGTDSPAANGGQTPRGRTATDTQKNNARAKKDALKDSLDELNKSTNKLRRKFDGTDNWITTKNLVETVVEDGRKVNTSLTKGNYGTEAARLWGVLRGGINDLARAYGVTPLGA
jgi:hypothetical protein